MKNRIDMSMKFKKMRPFYFMLSTLKKLMDHIGSFLSVCLSVLTYGYLCAYFYGQFQCILMGFIP